MKKRQQKPAAFPEQGPWLEDDLVVWRMRKNLPCAMCKRPLKKQRHDLAAMQKSGKLWLPTCLRCLHIDHLVFLPAGDSRVTRTASRLSSRRAVVMAAKRRFLQREGILVELAALREACEKYDIPLPPQLQPNPLPERSPQTPPQNTPQPRLFQTPEPPKPTPQPTTKRESTRKYRFFDTPAPKAAQNPQTPPQITPQPTPTQPTPPTPKSAARLTTRLARSTDTQYPNTPTTPKTTPPKKTNTDNTYTRTLAERIRDRYPRSPDKMIQEITQYALDVYLPKHSENNTFPHPADIDLGPLLTAFLQR